MPAYIPTPEHLEMTHRALQSLNDFSRPDQIILVDDGSPVRIETDLVDLIVRKPENEGFVKTVNRGWALATGDIIITANNDLTFNPEWLEAILYPLEHEYDISSIRVSDQEVWTTEDKITIGDKFGSLWAMKRKVYDSLGGLDERFGRGYFEDLDYRRQAINAGFRIAKNHAGLVEHLGRATFDTVDPERRLYRHNYQVFLDKWGFME